MSKAVVAWISFVAALLLAVPRPIEVRVVAIGAALGAAMCAIGFKAAAAARPRLPDRTAGQRSSLTVLALASGGALGTALLGLLIVLARTEPLVRARFLDRLNEPAWRPWTLAFESSILEEVAFRLFLLSAVAWLTIRLAPRGPVSSRAAFLLALAVSSLVFGLAHINAWASVTTPTATLIAVVLFLNATGGLLVGWIFWRWGLFYAICCHFAGDVVVQTLGPRLLS